MAATIKDLVKPDACRIPEGNLVRVEVTVTFTGVTTYTWQTGLTKVYSAGVKYDGLVSGGTGGGSVTPSTSTKGQVDIAGFTASDVQSFVAIGIQ